MGRPNGKRILVTGGAGFLGSFVTAELRRRGVEHIVVPRSAEYDPRDLGAIREEGLRRTIEWYRKIVESQPALATGRLP